MKWRLLAVVVAAVVLLGRRPPGWREDLPVVCASDSERTLERAIPRDPALRGSVLARLEMAPLRPRVGVGEPLGWRFRCHLDPGSRSRAFLLGRPEFWNPWLEVTRLGDGVVRRVEPYRYKSRVFWCGTATASSTEWVQVLQRHYDNQSDRPRLAASAGAVFGRPGRYRVVAHLRQRWQIEPPAVECVAACEVEVVAATAAEQRLWQEVGPLADLYTVLERQDVVSGPVIRWAAAGRRHAACPGAIWPQLAAVVLTTDRAGAAFSDAELARFEAGYRMVEALRETAPEWAQYTVEQRYVRLLGTAGHLLSAHLDLSDDKTAEALESTGRASYQDFCRRYPESQETERLQRSLDVFHLMFQHEVRRKAYLSILERRRRAQQGDHGATPAAPAAGG